MGWKRSLRTRGPIALGLVVAVFAVFHPVFHHDFVYLDDYLYVVDNPQVLEGLGLNSLFHTLREKFYANWLPLTLLS